MTAATCRVVVVGIGNPDRGDDGLGPRVARLVADRGVPDVAVLTPAEPVDLLDEWLRPDQVVVVVDAVRSGRTAGDVTVVDALREELPDGPPAASTHALGLDATVELLRALGRTPRVLLVVGVEATSFGVGARMSAPVAAAVPVAAGLVDQLVDAAVGGDL